MKMNLQIGNNIIKLSKNLFIQCLFSSLLARVIVEWHMISQFKTANTIIYNFLWINSGYLLSCLLIMLLHDSSIEITKTLNSKSNSNNKRILKGHKYTLIVIVNSITLLYIFTFNSKLLILSLSSGSPIILSTLIGIATKEAYLLIINNLWVSLIFLLSLCSKYAVQVLNILSNIFFVITVGSIWRENIYVYLSVDSSLLSSSSLNDLYTLAVILASFICFKLGIYLWMFFTKSNKLSDWSSNNVDINMLSQLLGIFRLVPVIFFFIINVFN